MATFFGSIVTFTQSQTDGLTLLAITAFYILLFYSILPRKFQIYEDRLRVALGNPFGFSIRLSNIKQARAGSGSKAFFYGGIRFATSSKSIVEIIRRKGMSIVISPANRDIFLEQLEQTIKANQG